MAQGHIRKGFFFYFGLFVLLLVAVFCISLVIMMFNPGKTVLWMQYFTSDGSDVLVSETTEEEKTSINWMALTDVEIKCSYADVTIEKNDTNDRKDGLYIINNSKGFAFSSNALPFSYNAVLENDGRKLVVDVDEANGFLYFSKDVKIILHAKSDSALDFSSINLKVTTGDGDVDIGGASTNKQREIGLHSLNVTTVKGSVRFTDCFNSISVKNIEQLSNVETPKSSFAVKTTDGKIFSIKKVEGDLTGLDLNCDLKLNIEGRGRINLGFLKLPRNGLYLTCKHGTMAIDKIDAKITSVYSIEGNHKFGEVKGFLTYSSSGDSVLAPNISIKRIDGDFNFMAANDASANARIEIKEITGHTSVVAEKGNLTVRKAHTANVQGKNLAVDMQFAEDCKGNVDIINEGGTVNLAFAGEVIDGVKVQTTSGKVNVKITDKAKFVATMKQNNAEGAFVADNKIKINIGNSMWGGQDKNPLTVNGGNGKFDIKTNSSITFDVVEKKFFA